MANLTESQNGADTFLEAVDFISRYYSSLLILTGLICNPLAFLVLSRKKFRDTTMTVYLRFLCVMDTVVICLGPIRFIMNVLHVDMASISFFCAPHLWLTNVAFYSSGWTLVLVTFERVVSIVKPEQVKTICSKTTAKVVIFIVLVIWGSTLSMLFKLWGHLSFFDPETNTTLARTCTIIHEPEKFGPAFVIFDILSSTFAPCFFIIIFNIIIVFGVIRSRKRVKKFSASHQKDSESGKTKFNMSQKEISLTTTLVLICGSFIVCNFPMCVFILGPHYQTAEGMGPHGDAISDLLMLVMMTNNALNFFFYFTTGSRFRTEFKNMFLEFRGHTTKKAM